MGNKASKEEKEELQTAMGDIDSNLILLKEANIKSITSGQPEQYAAEIEEYRRNVAELWTNLFTRFGRRKFFVKWIGDISPKLLQRCKDQVPSILKKSKGEISNEDKETAKQLFYNLIKESQSTAERLSTPLGFVKTDKQEAGSSTANPGPSTQAGQAGDNIDDQGAGPSRSKGKQKVIPGPAESKQSDTAAEATMSLGDTDAGAAITTLDRRARRFDFQYPGRKAPEDKRHSTS